MKKLELKLDELRVESFGTSPTRPETRGTVEARESQAATCGLTCYSCPPSCNGQSCWTCEGSCEVSVCFGYTCYPSCYGTCEATCGDTCTCGPYCW
jgi:hypothetical protein